MLRWHCGWHKWVGGRCCLVGGWLQEARATDACHTQSYLRLDVAGPLLLSSSVFNFICHLLLLMTHPFASPPRTTHTENHETGWQFLGLLFLVCWFSFFSPVHFYTLFREFFGPTGHKECMSTIHSTRLCIYIYMYIYIIYITLYFTTESRNYLLSTMSSLLSWKLASCCPTGNY